MKFDIFAAVSVMARVFWDERGEICLLHTFRLYICPLHTSAHTYLYVYISKTFMGRAVYTLHCTL
jgi:hypothetical protein